MANPEREKERLFASNVIPRKLFPLAYTLFCGGRERKKTSGKEIGKGPRRELGWKIVN